MNSFNDEKTDENANENIDVNNELDLNDNDNLMRFVAVYRLPVSNLESWKYGYDNPAPHIVEFTKIAEKEKTKKKKGWWQK